MSGERHDDMGAHPPDSRGDEFSGPTGVVASVELSHFSAP
jgi:hypothetical protein